MANKYNEKQEKLHKNYNDEIDEDKYEKEYEKEIENFHNKNKQAIVNTLKKFHTKKVMPFFKSGIILKNITDKSVDLNFSIFSSKNSL